MKNNQEKINLNGTEDTINVDVKLIIEDLLSHCDTLIAGGVKDELTSFVSGVYAVRGKIKYWESKLQS